MSSDDEELAGLSYAKAAEARNDPNYDRDLREQAADVQAVANEVSTVTIVTGRDPHIAVRLGDARNQPKLRQAAQRMGKLFEAPVLNAASPQPGDSGNARFSQPPRYTHWTRDHDK